MASNKTPNLGLDIWQPDDFFKRAEVNNNFTKIDSALINEIGNLSEDMDAKLADKASKDEVFTMANMGQDVREALTGGSVAVVGVNAVLTDNIVNKSVTLEKLHDAVTGKNRLNLNEAVDGYQLNISTGVPYAASNYVVSGYIPVTSGEYLYFATLNSAKTTYIFPTGTNTRICYYDANKAFIAGTDAATLGMVSNTDPITCKIPISYANAKFIRVTAAMSLSTFKDRNPLVALTTDYPTLASMLAGYEAYYYKLPKDKILGLPTKLSDLNNDAGYVTNADKSVTINMLADTVTSKNRLDLTRCLDSKRLNTTTGVVEDVSGWLTTPLMPAEYGESIFLATLNTNKTQYLYSGYGRYCLYDANKKFITGVNYSGYNSASYPLPLTADTVYIMFSLQMTVANLAASNPIVSTADLYPTPADMMAGYEAYYIKLPASIIEDIDGVSGDWKGKKWLTYGDSITAIGNVLSTTAWQYMVNQYYKFGDYLGRGVGSSTFCKSTQIWYANADGSYNSRDTDYATAPSGTTSHKGYFCSWDRITTMIPQDCDLIFVMGGTNDFGTGKPIGDYTWVANSTADSEWANSSYYNGGDFNIDCFKGAIASAVMKIQAWCPKAVIVLASPLSGRGDTAGANMTTPVVINGLSTKDFRNAVQDAAIYMSIPFVDVFGTTGINQLNRATYISDTVHPYQINGENKGNQALARAVIGGLKGVIPNFS
ncbi:SGNH/GDSL hydrolase family protein [Priestia sp. JV24]|uniref:SGNH/GDSL hydrolase family protein n=1 Tax=Priestia TaxID=2800373 RepID=UPI0021D69356|nr:MULTISPECIES: SGNH/GDSL hydrolase family protein [Priestia]MCU7712621.1 SGNH/GDSL hydrolase family protein [Priestia megaterium]MCW1043825.1 SGNH/GDSL hydrolase family protein [Priestia sp. JV24]